MKCGGCVSTVEKILNNSDGIENVSVNLLTESAYFEISQKHLEIETVLETLKENGFPSKIYINDFSKSVRIAETAEKGLFLLSTWAERKKIKIVYPDAL